MTHLFRQSSNTIQTKKVFLLFLLIATVISRDYHFDRSAKISTDNTLIKATAVKDDVLAVQSTQSSQSIVTLLQGNNFDRKTLEYSSPNQSQIIATTNGIFINDGNSIFKRKINRLNVTFSGQGSFQLFSDGTNMIVTSQYALVGKFDLQNPKLTKIDLATLEAKEIKYDSVDHWKAFAATILADDKNGEIIFGKGLKVFILKNQTLEKVQTIECSQNPDDVVGQIITYYNQTTGQSVLLIGRSPDNYDTLYYSVWRKNHSTQEYDDKSAFYIQKKLNGPIFVTDYDKAVSISGYQINYWNNITSILHQNYLDDDDVLGITPLAISNSQQFFFARNDSGFFSLYTVDADFQVSDQHDLFITLDVPVNAQITSDDNFLFFSTQNNSIYRVNISSNQIKSTTNSLDFYVFDASIDRIVSVIVQNNSYFFQLRTTSNLSVISSLQYNTNQTNITFNLHGNIGWGTIFIATIKLSNSTLVQTYKIDGDVITLVNSTQLSVNSSFYVCSKYLLVKQDGNSAIRVHNISDYTQVATINVTEFSNITIQAARNILIISDNAGTKRIIYDLDVSFQPKGYFYVNHNNAFDYCNFVIFPQRGAYYQIPRIMLSHQPLEVFYNIESPLIISTSIIESTNKTKDEAVYYQNEVNGTQCNLIFYVQYDSVNGTSKYTPQLVRYSECSQAVDKFTIQTSEAISSSSIFFSRDKRYIILGIKFQHSNYFLVELRSVANLSVVVRQNITTANYAYALNSFDVDITQDDKIIINNHFTVTVLELETQKFAENYGVASILLFDVADNITALAGVSLTNPNQTTIVVKNESSNQIIFNQNVNNITVQLLAISPLATLLAFYASDSNIYVWSVANQTLVLTNNTVGVVNIKFIDQSNLLVKYQSSYQILSINVSMASPQKPSSVQLSLQVTIYSVQVSNDGTLIAVVTDNLITIYEKDGDYVASYAAPLATNERVLSTSFSPSNNLIIITNFGNVYVLAATSCAPGTLVSDNLICIACEFPCKECSGSTTSCITYRASFYVLVILGPILFIAAIVIIVMCVKKRKAHEDASNQEQTEKQIKAPLKNDY